MPLEKSIFSRRSVHAPTRNLAAYKIHIDG